MSALWHWTIILSGMVVTYAIRLSFVVLLPPERMPDIVRRGLRYVPPTVLAAIILPELLLTEGALNISLSNDRLLTGIVAALVTWRFSLVWLTIVIGLVLLGVLTSLG